MRVGILTFHWANNYGAVLQAYSLLKAIQALGHTPKIINYIPKETDRGWYRGLGFKSDTRNIHKRILKKIRFHRFRNKFLPKTERYENLNSMRDFNDQFDAVIVGSDQVWNGNRKGGFNPIYYFNFIDNLICREISYSACFGQRQQPEQTLHNAGRYLKKFKSLSVRNKMSQCLVQEICQRDAKIVVDPSLLHDFNEFPNLKPAMRKKYILVYALSQDKGCIGDKLINIVKKKFQLPVVAISSLYDFKNADKTICSTGPIEWVNLIRNAKYVLTDSFHGTVFSLKFGVPFISWSGGRPERISDFLETYHLSDLFITQYDDNMNFLDIWNKECSFNKKYEIAKKKLKIDIEKSYFFLKKALS